MSFSENPVLQGLAAESDNFADPDADAISVVAMSDSECEKGVPVTHHTKRAAV